MLKSAKSRLISLAVLAGVLSVTTVASVSLNADSVEIAVLSEKDGKLSIERVGAPSREVALRMIEDYLETPGVVAASIPNEVSSYENLSNIKVVAAPDFNDPRRSEQWGLTRLEGESVQALANGSGVRVAVIDTGVEGSHPDLSHAVLPGFDVIGTSDGRVDPNGHGTHIAGIIAASSNNGVGTAGLASGVEILPVRALDETGYGDDAGIAEGVLWAVDNGADVINLSLGSPTRDPVLAAAVDSAISRGVTVVASSGNDGANGNPISYPAALPGVIAVSATSFGDQKAIFSTTGDYVSLAAPGVSIMSTWPGSGYAYSSGTSMSAPFVTASAALVQQSLGLSGSALKDRLTSSATDAGTPGFDTAFGFGVVDPYAALTDGVPRPPREGGGMPGLPTLPGLPGFPNLPALPGQPGLPSWEPPTLEPLPALTKPVLPAPPVLPESPTGTLPELRLDSALTLVKSARKGEEVTFEIKLMVNKVSLGKRDLSVETTQAGVWSAPEFIVTDSFGEIKLKKNLAAGEKLRVTFEGDRVGKKTVLEVDSP